MVLAWMEPPDFMTRSTHRLILGLALSVAAHGLLIAGVHPMTAAFPTASPLQVELLDVSPVTAAATVTSARSEFPVPVPAGSLPAAAEPAKLEQPQANRGAERMSGPDLRFTPDRYFMAGELDVRAEPVNEVPLIYPQLAYQNRTNGRVLLRILINERGGIDQIAVLEAEPRGIFEEAALAATQPLRFSPAIKNARPVRSQKIVEVTFDPYESIHIP